MSTPQPLARQFNLLRSLTIALVGNLSLACQFFIALVDPVAHEYFISQLGIMVYLFEFLSIHSTMMLMGFATDDRPRWRSIPVALVGGYGIFALAIGVGFHTWVAPIFFMVSVISKLAGKPLNEEAQRRAALPIAWLLLWTFVTVPMADFWQSVFPFPENLHLKTTGTGVFVDQPQALLVWGMGYFITLAIVDVYFFRKALRGRRMRLADTNIEI